MPNFWYFVVLYIFKAARRNLKGKKKGFAFIQTYSQGAPPINISVCGNFKPQITHSYLVGHFSAKGLLLLTAMAAGQEKLHGGDANFPSK